MASTMKHLEGRKTGIRTIRYSSPYLSIDIFTEIHREITVD
jgi:hypothetical protein